MLQKFGGFKLDITNEELAQSNNKSSDFLTAGDHELEVLEVDYKGPVKSDESWLRYVLILGKPGTVKSADGKFKGTVRHSVMVPTSSLRYNGKTGVFKMLQGFFDGIGEEFTPGTEENPGTVETLLNKYFFDPSVMVGLKLKVRLGYKNPYIGYNDKQFFIYKADGSLLIPDAFPNRNMAEGHCLTHDITIDKYLEVRKIYPGEKQREDKPKAKKAKASASW